MTAIDIINATKAALKQFGTYSFDDKGPGEVMHIRQIVAALELMPAPQVAQIILQLASTHELEDERGRVVASTLVGCMEDWDELFDQPGIEDLY